MFEEELLGFFCGCASGGGWYDECNRHSTLDRVTYGYNIGLTNTRMAQENIDNLLGIDIFAGHIDHVVFASDEVEETVFVTTHEVSRIKPPVAEFLRRDLGKLPVTFGQSRIAGNKFANLISAQLGDPILADDFDIRAGNLSSATPAFDESIAAIANWVGPTFRQTIAFRNDGLGKGSFKVSHQFFRDLGRTANCVAERFHIVPAELFLLREDPGEHGRYSRHVGHFVARDRPDDLYWIEAGQNHHGSAA